MSDAEGKIKINEEFCKERIAAYKIMFPMLETIGWYSSDGASNNDVPTAADAIVHKMVAKVAEKPLYLILNPQSKEATDKK